MSVYNFTTIRISEQVSESVDGLSIISQFYNVSPLYFILKQSFNLIGFLLKFVSFE